VAVKVFVDANLLFYKLISDLLFDASNLGVIKAYWSEEVISEYLLHGPRILNEIRKRHGLTENIELATQMINKKVELFKRYSGFILVEDYDSQFLPSNTLTDQNDLHVTKAALKANCSVLLTLDKDFRQISSVNDLSIIAKKADDFFCELFDNHEEEMIDVIEATRRGLERQKNRTLDLNDLVDLMNQGHLIKLSLRLYNFLKR
jgi:predicted nucleic acid-binding protein